MPTFRSITPYLAALTLLAGSVQAAAAQETTPVQPPTSEAGSSGPSPVQLAEFIPSGNTCVSKVTFYLLYGGIRKGKVAVSECNNPARSTQLMTTITSIEAAAKFVYKNPIGMMSIASEESRLVPYLHDYATGEHKGLFQIGQYNLSDWSRDFNKTARVKYLSQKKRNPNAKLIKIDSNLYNPRTNAYLAAVALRNHGSGPWDASKDKWGRMASFVTGRDSQYSAFLRLQPLFYPDDIRTGFGSLVLPTPSK